MHTDFKNPRNQVIYLTSKSKSYFFKTFFKNNQNKTANIWKDLKLET